MNGSGTLAERVTKKAETTEFVLKAYAPALLRQQIDRLKLWDKQPHIQVDTLAGYFTQYLYMPRLRDHGVIHTVIRHMTDVLLPGQDGFAYADGIDGGRYRGLTIEQAPAVVSGTGLVVDPNVAERQIADEQAAHDDSGETSAGGAQPGASGPSAKPTTQDKPTRFHATKALDAARPVRDISLISDEILTPLFTANGIDIRVSIDIESSSLEKLTPEQVTVLKENLATLGFTDWSIE